MQQYSLTKHADRPLWARLSKYIGRYLLIQVNLNLQQSSTVEGVLTEIGEDFFLLLHPDNGSEILCDLNLIKYATVYPKGMRPCPSDIRLCHVDSSPALPASSDEEETISTTPAQGGLLLTTTPDGLHRMPYKLQSHPEKMSL